jgi:hypothetical protein
MNKRQRTSPNHNKTVRKKPKSPKPEEEIICKRRKRKTIIPMVELLSRAPKGYISNIPLLNEEDLRRKIKEEIKPGPQFVTVAVSPKTHTILVNITNEKIYIVDWNGEDVQHLGLKYIDNEANEDYDENWKNYSQAIQLIQEKYGNRPVEYYPVDEELYDKADKKAEAGGGGGCAEYVYEWADRYSGVIDQKNQ